LIRDFNLLATTERRNESDACSELWMLLRAVGDETPAVDRSPVRGLITARTDLNPFVAVKRLRAELHESPDHFRVLLRVIPVEAVIQTGLEEIVEAIHELASRIGEEESFRITVEKRRTVLQSMEVIDAVADGIDRKVVLEEPDWIVLIEIVGRVTGISVIRPEYLLNVQKEKARLSADG
jgi:tRNA acetyltransferase TAN1